MSTKLNYSKLKHSGNSFIQISTKCTYNPELNRWKRNNKKKKKKLNNYMQSANLSPQAWGFKPKAQSERPKHSLIWHGIGG